MAFRGGQNRNRNFGGNYGGGNRGGMNPWDGQGGGNYGGGMGGGRQGGGGQGMNAEALSLANNLLNNLLRNPNPPSLLDLPRGGGGMGGNRNRQMGNRVGGGGNGNRNNNNRRQGGANRGNQKPGNKQSSGGVRNKQNALDRAKKLLAKNSNKKKDSTSGENAKNTESQSPYADVPNDMFYCHLCKKHMWDAVSFENHIKGRTHLMMREGIEESYRLKANMIRQEAKIAETLKSIELDRLKRMGKSGKRGMMEYCTMCDLSFHGHLSTHRKSEGHLQLKKFLHPKCSECIKEFPTRIEYDTHLLSPDHLKKAAEKNTKVGDRKLLQSLQILTEEEELKDVRPPQKRKKKVEEKEGAEKKEGEEGAEGEKKENGEGEGEEVKKEEEAEEDGDHEGDETKEGDQTMEEGKEDEYEEVPLPVDPEDCILDFEDDTEIPSEVEAKLPKYNWTRPVGAKLIKSLACIECRLCQRFFDNEKTAEIHTRTVYHHRNFLKFITEKSADSKIAQKRAAAAAEEVERKKKRLEEAEAAAAAKTTEGGEAAAEEGGDLYDPSEATGDDEDVDMAANGEKNGDAANESTKEEGDAEKMEDEDTAAAAADAKAEDDAVEQPQAPEPPVITESPTPAPAATPAKRAAAAKSTTTTPRNTPARNRGRGRYNRY